MEPEEAERPVGQWPVDGHEVLPADEDARDNLEQTDGEFDQTLDGFGWLIDLGRPELVDLLLVLFLVAVEPNAELWRLPDSAQEHEPACRE